MRLAAQCLIKHISANDPALLIIDSDCDGYCSGAILLNYLNRLFPSWVQKQVDYIVHEGKQHGLSDIPIDDKYKLILIPDAASNDYEYHASLRAQGKDIIILDHHEAEKISTDAIVINNQLCDYPTKSLCGGGVVYKFICYLDSVMQTHHAIEYEDLVALALIGDMMDQRDFETHFLTIDGLKRIRNPFFVEMMNRQKRQFEGQITPIGIAFYIVPYINAMTRSGTMEEKYLMFEAMLEWRSDDWVPSTKRGYKGTVETRHEQAGRTCVNVKSRQKRTQDTSLANIENIIFELNLLDNKMLIIPVEESEVDKNLAGLIANQLASKYARPTLILRKIIHDDGSVTYEGSGRNPGRSRLENMRQFCLDTELVLYAEGHASAFGCGITEENLQAFVDKTNELLKDFDFSPCYMVDLILDGRMINDNEIFNIASYNDIWGQELSEPLIAIENIPLNADTIHFLGANQKTLRINLEGKKTNMIKFNISDEDKAVLDPNGGVLTATIIGKCDMNYYMGTATPQIKIEDFEINKRMLYDF